MKPVRRVSRHLSQWKAVDDLTGRPLRDGDGRLIRVMAYTRRSAVHQLKRMVEPGRAFTVEA